MYANSCRECTFTIDTLGTIEVSLICESNVKYINGKDRPQIVRSANHILFLGVLVSNISLIPHSAPMCGGVSTLLLLILIV